MREKDRGREREGGEVRKRGGIEREREREREREGEGGITIIMDIVNTNVFTNTI